ncbi:MULTISPECIES: hypothetical protein [Nocardia]|uniref:hypothetical protein n=1 Tax=Nocardia TaxID=1817 RepID=UPI00130022A3|nr:MULTISPECIES: hypothetical protein [Nocardia]
MSTSIEIATAAYAMAAAIDQSIPAPTKMRLQAWAALFEGQDLGVTEAVQAVKDYYRQPNRFPIKPGDILAITRTMPVTSSPERVEAFIDRWSVHPYSRTIQDLTGIEWSPPDPPKGFDVDDAEKLREFHLAAFRKWIARNHTRMVALALSNGEPLELPL